jgi:sporulation protein YlmC with PRC-barrel domain
MEADDFIGMDVVDATGQNIGKIEDVDINDNNGIANDIIVKLDKGIFSRDTEKIKFDKIDNVKDVVLLNIKIKM